MSSLRLMVLANDDKPLSGGSGTLLNY